MARQGRPAPTDPAKAGGPDFISYTAEFWTGRVCSVVNPEQAAQIIANMVAFVELLLSWSAVDMDPPFESMSGVNGAADSHDKGGVR